MAILPPATLGMLGGGQLGRMFVTAARTMGYQVIVVDPDPDSPAGSMANQHLQTAYDDPNTLDYLARHCSVVSTEFENIPLATIKALQPQVAVYPDARALEIAQNRIREKTFFQSLGLPTAGFIPVAQGQSLNTEQNVQFPVIVKTATLGYDGKGQVNCSTEQQLQAALQKLDTDCIIEQRIELKTEVSVVLSRGRDGQSHFFPVAENFHSNGILDTSRVPAQIPSELQQQACDAAKTIADALDYCGVLAVEFFVSQQGELLVNEMAPRPHNSGHFSLNACPVSQFEQQVRMICGLPSGDCTLHTPVIMLNLLGDLWPNQGMPDWQGLLQDPVLHLHLYAKKAARPGRKMGHINLVGKSPQQLEASLSRARSILGIDTNSP